MLRRQFVSLSLAATAFSSTRLMAQETTTDAGTPKAEVLEMVLGNPDAKVVLKEYASFTCPHCARFHIDVMPSLKADYIDTGKIKFIYREVYFDRLGLWAGMLARCGGPEKYFGITDMLYTRQREWTQGKTGADIAENLYKIGRVAGLTDDAMVACLQDQDKAKALVETFQKNAEKDSIDSTPTLMINDVDHGNQSYSALKKLLDAALNG
ncbi:MAG: DsbA family protein [Rhodobacterales bacterium]